MPQAIASQLLLLSTKGSADTKSGAEALFKMAARLPHRQEQLCGDRSCVSQGQVMIDVSWVGA